MWNFHFKRFINFYRPNEQKKNLFQHVLYIPKKSVKIKHKLNTLYKKDEDCGKKSDLI